MMFSVIHQRLDSDSLQFFLFGLLRKTCEARKIFLFIFNSIKVNAFQKFDQKMFSNAFFLIEFDAF